MRCADDAEAEEVPVIQEREDKELIELNILGHILSAKEGR